MRAHWKHRIALFLPPIVVELVRRVRRRPNTSGYSVPLATAVLAKPEWEAVPDSDAVWECHSGWAHPSIVETQLDKWSTFLDNAQSATPLGVSHEAPPGTAPDVAPHNAIMTFGYVLGRALAGGKAMSVLDWGGGLGHYAVYARALYPAVSFDYVIKDLDSLCAGGRTVQSDINFVSNEGVALARGYDLVFASSSLHYTRDFYDLLDKICTASMRYLMITRIPIVAEHDDFVVVQRPHRYGYLTEYACWFVNRAKLISFIEARGLRLVREFLLGERPFVPNAPEQCLYGGFLFERRK